MAKPRIFLSSTCYDLSEVRDRICEHLTHLGMEAVSSDDPKFGVTPGTHSHHACLDEVDRADYLVLIVGGRRGGTFVGSEKSITNEEYSRAAARRIPILPFIRKDVLTARRIFKKNPRANVIDFVDDTRIFDFIDVIESASESNWFWPFETGGEICDTLTAQFAHIVKLYSERVVADKTPTSPGGQENIRVVAFPGRLTRLPKDYQDDDSVEAWITKGLRTVHKTIAAISNSPAAGKDEKLKTLWVFGRYGESDHDGALEMKNDQFKQFAWSTYRGRRVFEQLKIFGVVGSYDVDDRGDGPPIETIRLRFDEDGGEATDALALYVNTLVTSYGAEAGLSMFRSGDMTVFS